MIPVRCVVHPDVVMRTSDDLDKHDALHLAQERIEADPGSARYPIVYVKGLEDKVAKLQKLIDK